MTAPADELKSKCPKASTKEGIVVYRVLSEGVPEILVYRSERGDYIVADDFCTCPSFLHKLDKEEVEPCKHICAEKRFTEATTIELSPYDFDVLLESLLLRDRSITLNLLVAHREGGKDGEETQEEEDYR